MFSAWEDKKIREKWLSHPGFTIRKATSNKSLRIIWVDGKSSLEVQFYRKGAAKSSVAIEHSKLPDARTGEKMKAYWGRSLERLAATLTS